jgi:hypothetical protein
MATGTQLALIGILDKEKRSPASSQYADAQRQNIEGQGEEAALVLAAKRGDCQAFEILIERYQRRILALARRFTGNQEDAELPKSFHPLAQIRREISLLHVADADRHQRSPYVAAQRSRTARGIHQRFKRK